MEPNINNLNEAEQAELARLMDKAENGKPNPDSGNPRPTEEKQNINTANGVTSPTPFTDDPNRKWGEAPAPNPPEIKRVLDASDWVDKQVETMKSVGKANYLKGIKSPKDDPIKAGIRAQKKYEEKMKDDAVLKRRKTQLEKTNMAEWAAMAETLGADKIVEGVVKRKHKIERFVGKYRPLLLEHLKTIDGMADVTDADRENKMLENKRGLQALKGKA